MSDVKPCTNGHFMLNKDKNVLLLFIVAIRKPHNWTLSGSVLALSPSCSSHSDLEWQSLEIPKQATFSRLGLLFRLRGNLESCSLAYWLVQVVHNMPTGLSKVQHRTLSFALRKTEGMLTILWTVPITGGEEEMGSPQQTQAFTDVHTLWIGYFYVLFNWWVLESLSVTKHLLLSKWQKQNLSWDQLLMPLPAPGWLQVLVVQKQHGVDRS